MTNSTNFREPSILERIVAQRRKDVEELKLILPQKALEKKLREAPPTINFRKRLDEGHTSVIAEIKRASPSKGDIAIAIDAAQQAALYSKGGAAGISVLTEPKWFKGNLTDLQAARQIVEHHTPERPGILRKDFIVDEYQIIESRNAGADAILLIVACLGADELAKFLEITHELDMEALVEVNSAQEMEIAKKVNALLIGINNRNLATFEVDLNTTQKLAKNAPQEALLAALSGISSREDVVRFENAGAKSVLVGEALMLATNPSEVIADLAGTSRSQR